MVTVASSSGATENLKNNLVGKMKKQMDFKLDFKTLKKFEELEKGEAVNA